MFGRKKSNILIIKTDSLPGFIAAEPAFEAIRDAHQGAMISLLTTPALQRIARASSYFDQVAAMPAAGDSAARKEFIKQLKNAQYERVYDLAANEDAKKLFTAMGMFRPKWFSASLPSKRRRKDEVGRALPSFDKLFNDAELSVPNRLPDFRWALSARKDSANMKPSWYGVSGAYGLLLPRPDETGRWSAQGYAMLADTMAKAGYMPVLAGPKELHEFGDAIADVAPQLVDLTGKTDHLQLAALANEAAFFVSDDADEMQLAVSVGCDGVLISTGKAASVAPAGRHVVVLRSASGPGELDAAFVWRTLANMGLANAEQGEEGQDGQPAVGVGRTLQNERQQGADRQESQQESPAEALARLHQRRHPAEQGEHHQDLLLITKDAGLGVCRGLGDVSHCFGKVGVSVPA